MDLRKAAYTAVFPNGHPETRMKRRNRKMRAARNAMLALQNLHGAAEPSASAASGLGWGWTLDSRCGRAWRSADMHPIW